MWPLSLLSAVAELCRCALFLFFFSIIFCFQAGEREVSRLPLL